MVNLGPTFEWRNETLNIIPVSLSVIGIIIFIILTIMYFSNKRRGVTPPSWQPIAIGIVTAITTIAMASVYTIVENEE